MIEQEVIKQYPSLVARPYLLIKDDIQRKDMQRFWFENTISFLAVLSAAELVQFYKELKGKEEKTEKDIESIKSLQDHKSLTMVGLEHMSLGKWVMMLRETTKTLREYNAAKTIPELVEFYHGKKGKNNAKLIDKLVSIRNDDAHGNPIPEDKLKIELDKRQQLIDGLLGELDFLSNYNLILPENIEIEGSKQFYICKEFIGNGIVNTKQTFDFAPNLSEVMLVNKTQKEGRINLSPLLLYLGVQNEENNFLGIFSKFSSKDGTEAKYLNLDGSAVIDLVNFGQENEVDLISERQSYSEIYSDPESFQVNLNVEMKFEDASVNIKEESNFSIIIDNSKSTDIEEARIVLDVPNHIQIISPIECKEASNVSYVDQSIVVEFDSIEENKKITIAPIVFTVLEQGSYSIDSGRVLYGFYKSIADKESGQLTEEDIQFDSVAIEASDPNSHDKMIPVVNVNKGFVDADDNPIQNVRIGEDFIFKIIVTNIGFSSAKNVLVDLVFPDNINLKQGKETISIGQLNPFESRTFKYVLNSHIPNVYTITMQNILYMDSKGGRYTTRCADDHFIIVRSDLVKEFVYTVKEHIDDLYIDEEEKKSIGSMVKSLAEAIGIDAEQTYREAETEAVVKIIRDLVEKTAAKKELKVSERIYEEGKRDSKITNNEPRKFLVFSSKEMPFFAINLSKGFEPEFFALRTNIDRRFDQVLLRQAVVKEGSYTLDHRIDFSDIKYSEKYGKAFFSQWLNIILTRFSKEYLAWKMLADNIGEIYGGPLAYISGQFAKYYSQNSSRESGTVINYVLSDRENPQSFYVSFDRSPTQNFKQVMRENMEGRKNFVFLNESSPKDKSRIYDAKQLSYYMQYSDTGRATKLPAVSLSIRDQKSMDEMMEKTQELWKFLCLSQSLDLLDGEFFSGQNYIEQLKEFTKKLFEKGFALRENKNNEKMLDIYPLKNFSPHSAVERDCIGFVSVYYNSWQIYLDFFKDGVDEDLANELSLVSSGDISGKVRWIKSDIKSEEQFNKLTEVILEQADNFEAKSLSIWPKVMQREMILNHGQTDSGFFILLKNILSGKSSYMEILEEFKTMNIEKELDRTLRRNEQFEDDAGYEAPLYVEGSDENKVIGYKDFLEETLMEMLEDKLDFSYLEEGSRALLRIQASQIVKNYDFLRRQSPSSRGHIWRGFKKIKSKYFRDGGFTVTPTKDKNVEFAVFYSNCKNDFEELLKKTFADLENKYDNNFGIEHTGRKGQHIKLFYNYTYTDFDSELESMQNICNEFFSEVENGTELFSEKN